MEIVKKKITVIFLMNNNPILIDLFINNKRIIIKMNIKINLMFANNFNNKVNANMEKIASLHIIFKTNKKINSN
jgi:hypothetical protein